MRLLKSLVTRNIQHARTRRSEILENDISTIRYWDGYISALESIVHVLPDDEELHEPEQEEMNGHQTDQAG
jgi:hypothetical protein